MSKKKLIITFSPFDFRDMSDGGRYRIGSVNHFLEKEYEVLLHIIRNENKSFKNIFSIEAPIFLSFSNKYLHIFFSLIAIKKIFLVKKSHPEEEIFLYGHLLWGGIFVLFMNLIFGIPYIFDNHNVEYLRFKRCNNLLWPLIFLLEKTICRRAFLVYCCSDYDKIILESKYGILVEVLPTSVHVFRSIVHNRVEIRKKILSELGLQHDIFVILFFGSFSYFPNIQALRYIEKDIAPSCPKNAIFLIAGKGLEKSKKNNIIYLGFVDSIDEYIVTSDLVFTPLFSGSGTKIKILQSLAYNVPVLGTSIAGEGIQHKNLQIVPSTQLLGELTKRITYSQ